MKYCLTNIECGIIQEHITWKGFNDSKRLLDRSQYIRKVESKRISATLPKFGKKSFKSAVVIPTEMRFFNYCNDETTFDRCKNQVNENREFEVSLYLIKRQPPKQFVHMLPYFK